MAQTEGGDAGALALGLRQQVTGLGLRVLAAKALHVAILAPERLTEVYGNAAAGWLSKPVFPRRPRGAPSRFAPVSPAFWTDFWALTEAQSTPWERGDFTRRVIALNTRLPAALQARVAAVALDFPGVAKAAAGGLPKPFRLSELARCPAGSLGAALYRQAGLGRVDLQAGENAGGAMAQLPPPLGYVNIRILQCYPLWRMVAGYDRGGLDEVGLAAFQMAQFGHHYASLFIAIVLSSLALNRPQGLEIVLDSIFKGWTHGRETRSMLDAPWEDLWDLPIDQVRDRLGVTPFDSPLGAAMRMLNRIPQGS